MNDLSSAHGIGSLRVFHFPPQEFPMIDRRILLCVFMALSAHSLVAQGPQGTLYFSSRFTETPASGRGGFITALAPNCFPSPTFGSGVVNEALVTNSPGLNAVIPGVLNTTIPNSPPPGMMTTDYVEISNIPQIQTILGDIDGDGIAHECADFPGIDAIHIVNPELGRMNTMHEMFVSTYRSTSGSCGHSVGTQGYIGTGIEPADLVLIPSAPNYYPAPSVPGTPIFFVRRAQWETLLGLPSTLALDIDAFTVAPSGDIYFSVASEHPGASIIITPGGAPVSTTLNRGDILRVPAAAYTPSGPFGVMTAPVPGMVERVYASGDVMAMMTSSGGILSYSPLNVYGLSVDPALAPTVTPLGFMVDGLMFTVDNRGGSTSGTQNATSSAVYCNQGTGSFATVNGQTLNAPNAVGMNDQSFNNGFFAGPLDALCLAYHTPPLDPLFSRPIHLDTFPTTNVVTDPLYNGILTCYLSGLLPNTQAGILASASVVPPGGFVPRWNISNSAAGYPDLYVDVFGAAGGTCLVAPTVFSPFCQFAAAQLQVNNGVNPIMSAVDPTNASQNGDTCFQIDLSPYLPAGSMPLVPTVVLTIQVIEFQTLRLSDPLTFVLN